MNKRGFTLIELLAVIVILAIITAITVPKVSEMINTAREGAAQDSFYGVMKSAELSWTKTLSQNNALSESECVFNEEKIECTNSLVLNVNGEIPREGKISLNSSGSAYVSAGDSLYFNGYYCCGMSSKLYCKKNQKPESSETNGICIAGSGGAGGGKTLAAIQLRSKVVTSGEGLYADTYEEGRYVYKGAAPANYITFNGEEAGWRIISVEVDGTIKIMRNSSIGKQFWDTSNSNNWARPATLNTYLNSTYKNSIDTTYIQTHDFGVGAVTNNNTDLAAQITAEKSSVWNGDIGLMSVSDYLRANTNTAQCGSYSLNNSNKSTCATTNWIAVALKSSYPWTISARADSLYNSVFYVNFDGTVGAGSAGDPYLNDNIVVPVLYLSSDITLSGSGTDIDPYEIVA